MIVFFIIVIVLLGAVFFLRGEGESYGKGQSSSNDEKKAGFSDKNFFL